MQNIIRAAMGEINSQLVLKNVTYLNVFTNEWLKCDIALQNGTIVGLGSYKGETEIDCAGKYAVPGFIDSHVHIESSLATPAIFAKEILPYGTTCIVADPHEIANVGGELALSYMFSATQALPMNAYIMLPSCVPATPYETSGAKLNSDILTKFVDESNCLGLGEMMNNTFMNDCDNDTLAKLIAFKGKNIDGHAPMLAEKNLNAYRACGILNDHETSFKEDMLLKVRLGFKILARNGSSCRNLETLIKAAKELNIPYSNFAYCSDDKHISDIRAKGHISHCIKLALESGAPIAEAYKMASFYPAQNFGLRHLGAIAPSYQGDIVLLDDINNVHVTDVLCKGQMVVQNNKLIAKIIDVPCPINLQKSVHCNKFDVDNLKLDITNDKTPIIGVLEGELLTSLNYATLPLGEFNYCGGYKKVVVYERHGKKGNFGVGLVENYNINGAIASTVSHDSHNIVAIGSNDSDIATAINRLAEINGGYVVVLNGKVTAEVALPIAGLLSNEEPELLHKQLNFVISSARAQGVSENLDPLQPLSFLALTVLPRGRITDFGVVDTFNASQVLKF